MTSSFDYQAFGIYRPSGSRIKPEVMSLSGGRSSAHALISLLNGGFGKQGDIVSFQNTGQEHQTCYDFLRDLQKILPIPITWLEFTNTEIFTQTLLRKDFSYDRFHLGEYDNLFEIFDVIRLSKMQYKKSKNNFWYADGFRSNFKVVDYETAAHNSKPFTDAFLYKCAIRLLTRKSLILPNAAQRWCTADMKIKVLDRYLKSSGVENYVHYFGMRHDEPERVDKIFRLNDSSRNVYHDCPLHWNYVTKSDVQEAWSRQPIDLGFNGNINNFRDFLGNCVYCHLKAKIKKLYLMQQGYDFAFYRQLERIVNNYNFEKSAMSNQAGTYEELYNEAMDMREITVNEVLSDTEKEVHCVSCGD